MDTCTFLKGVVGPCGMEVWYLPESVVSEKDVVRSAGVFLGQHEEELKAAGGVYLGIDYDAMGDAYAEITGEVFSVCQVLGIPCTILCDDMSWGDGYAGYAAMLGVRSSLVLFMLRLRWGRDVSDASLAGLKSLREAGFKAVAYYDGIVWTEGGVELVQSLVCDWLFEVCPVWLSVSSLNVEWCKFLVGRLVECYPERTGGFGVVVNEGFQSLLTRFLTPEIGLCVTSVSETSAPDLWCGVDLSRVEAGDIDAMVQEASRATAEVSQDRFRELEVSLSRRERRAARRQLAKDRKKVSNH